MNFTDSNLESIVNLAFVDPRLSREGSNWRVSDRYTVSDHQASDSKFRIKRCHLNARLKKVTSQRPVRKGAISAPGQDRIRGYGGLGAIKASWVHIRRI